MRRFFPALLLFLALPGAGQNKLLEMSDKLDQLEKQDFQAALDKARLCTLRRDYDCAESALAKAAKSAGSAADRSSLTRGRLALYEEKEEEARELREAEERRLAAERAERERIAREEEEERLAEEREAEARRRQREMEEESSSPSESTAAMLTRYIQQKAAENAAILNKLNRDTAAAFAETNRRLAAQQAERDRARRDADEREADRRRQAARERDQRQAAEDRRLAAERRENERRAAEAREREREAQDRRDRAERERIAAQEKAERERQLAQQRADRLEQERRDKAAEQAERTAYLQRMAREIQLGVGKCPDGEGHYYANGTMPRGGKEVVSCIDVHYEASCPGSNIVSRGVADNFVGLSGCYGDTYKIEPRPACKVSEVRIRVVKVTEGCK
ncbi:hypothetical protein [Massilia endophytica]|uniref:hypothetical protein n=1 Tax=Massilia endophytica TaxID=2899220 RepID=UPI001E399689|nr:hypothetical protein [Massilia endophytica]UGQ45160.1 hypothetical protein LSQ66_15305 [Massilia endophytica]